MRSQVEELLALSTMVLRFDPSRFDGANVQLLGLLDAINVGDGPDEPSMHAILGEGADSADATSDQRLLNSSPSKHHSLEKDPILLDFPPELARRGDGSRIGR